MHRAESMERQGSLEEFSNADVASVDGTDGGSVASNRGTLEGSHRTSLPPANMDNIRAKQAKLRQAGLISGRETPTMPTDLRHHTPNRRAITDPAAPVPCSPSGGQLITLGKVLQELQDHQSAISEKLASTILSIGEASTEQIQDLRKQLCGQARDEGLQAEDSGRRLRDLKAQLEAQKEILDALKQEATGQRVMLLSENFSAQTARLEAFRTEVDRRHADLTRSLQEQGKDIIGMRSEEFGRHLSDVKQRLEESLSSLRVFKESIEIGEQRSGLRWQDTKTEFDRIREIAENIRLQVDAPPRSLSSVVESMEVQKKLLQNLGTNSQESQSAISSLRDSALACHKEQLQELKRLRDEFSTEASLRAELETCRRNEAVAEKAALALKEERDRLFAEVKQLQAREELREASVAGYASYPSGLSPKLGLKARKSLPVMLAVGLMLALASVAGAFRHMFQRRSRGKPPSRSGSRQGFAFPEVSFHRGLQVPRPGWLKVRDCASAARPSPRSAFVPHRVPAACGKELRLGSSFFRMVKAEGS